MFYGEYDQYVKAAIVEALRPVVIHPGAGLFGREFLLEREHIRVARRNRRSIFAEIGVQDGIVIFIFHFSNAHEIHDEDDDGN